VRRVSLWSIVVAVAGAGFVEENTKQRFLYGTAQAVFGL